MNIIYKGFGLIFQKIRSYGCFIDLRLDTCLFKQRIMDNHALLVFLTNEVIYNLISVNFVYLFLFIIT